MKIKSAYKDNGHNFSMKVIKEEQDFYWAQLDKEWQNQFHEGEGDKITKLEKRLIGSLYEIEQEYQLSMF